MCICPVSWDCGESKFKLTDTALKQLDMLDNVVRYGLCLSGELSSVSAKDQSTRSDAHFTRGFVASDPSGQIFDSPRFYREFESSAMSFS